MRLHRLVAILLLLESRGKLKAKELAEALETSVRSIYRDVDTLAESGVPIVSAPGPSGGLSLMEGYTVDLKSLHNDDVVHLYLTGLGIYSGAGTESGHKLRSALLKLEKTLPDEYKPDLHKAKSRFYFDDTPWWRERPDAPCLETVRAALWKSHKLTIHYRKPGGELSIRDVRPYGLVVKQGEWYLAAYSEMVEEVRTFKCERISAAEQLEGGFEIPADFSLEHYWKGSNQSFKRSRQEREVYPVILRVKEPSVNLRNKLEILHTAWEQNTALLTVNMYGYEAACRDILELIGCGEVVAPEELRAFIKDKLDELRTFYGD
ncbi:Predicted DNA-binding transcriptional regulator YafY, contains an HTH and WYL domains [Paenibacillus sophorae]|uniref:Predicted DNA-binding transcriptional regulator YafY, contains an HTH and WYL domains n=1 Tax=Paenibacillus sophorae TaxID=1333845 RepID=A0A1H8FS52_9BACL|nr:YafY family protein [Paenibacillus sophorae]QWU13957.1 YafY family transcriptional regulator [Paenibacillus sophorae]SEN34375.1 Predicted DNA-binding transcriptional regulator YafY, contains an HTH and WYL domains [Paenibacillus sophorae]